MLIYINLVFKKTINFEYVNLHISRFMIKILKSRIIFVFVGIIFKLLKLIFIVFKKIRKSGIILVFSGIKIIIFGKFLDFQELFLFLRNFWIFRNYFCFYGNFGIFRIYFCFYGNFCNLGIF